MNLPNKAREELSKLTIAQRWNVLQGLQRKLWHLDRTRRLSYKYEVCPVCNDIGSTLENPKCDGCYIQVACKHPFEAGFRDDQPKGEAYFRNMLEFMMGDTIRPPTLVVGGNWDRKGRESKIATQIAKHLDADLINGGKVDDLQNIDTIPYRIIVWIANVPNEEEKFYPRKGLGAVLVVSKAMRDGVTSADAAERIFNMRGNAVIEIYKEDRLKFRLADALNNSWADTEDVQKVCDGIKILAEWTFRSARIPSKRINGTFTGTVRTKIPALIELVKEVADKVETEMGGRYFGNVSTRCMKMFPSASTGVAAYVSPRNVDKHRIEADDMIFTYEKDGVVFYSGSKKPSVDTAIHLRLYQLFPHLRFMIHGHAHVPTAPFTTNYYPCGDLREVNPLASHLMKVDEGIVNLKNHGFLIYTSTIKKMEELIKNAVFKNRL